MSDQLPRPDYDGLIRMSGDAMWNEGYALGVQDSMLRATQIERVLTDLIEELRETHRMTQDEWHGEKLQDRWCLGCERRDDWAGLTPWPCPSAEAADRAEARLRELDTPTG